MATYTVTISAADETALDNDLLDKDAWIQAAVVGKINNCKKRMINEWRPIIFADDSVGCSVFPSTSTISATTKATSDAVPTVKATQTFKWDR